MSTTVILDNKPVLCIEPSDADRVLRDFRWEVKELGYEVIQSDERTGAFTAYKPGSPPAYIRAYRLATNLA